MSQWIKNYTLTKEQEQEVEKELQKGKIKYALIADIIWESPCPEEFLSIFDKELEDFENQSL